MDAVNLVLAQKSFVIGKGGGTGSIKKEASGRTGPAGSCLWDQKIDNLSPELSSYLPMNLYKNGR